MGVFRINFSICSKFYNFFLLASEYTCLGKVYLMRFFLLGYQTALDLLMLLPWKNFLNHNVILKFICRSTPRNEANSYILISTLVVSKRWSQSRGRKLFCASLKLLFLGSYYIITHQKRMNKNFFSVLVKPITYTPPSLRYFWLEISS